MMSESMQQHEQLKRCGRRRKVCGNCNRRYTGADHELWQCPDCGRDRHCRNFATGAGGACKYHGGRSPAGIAARAFKDGRHRRGGALSGRLRKLFEVYLNDPETRSNLSDLALAVARTDALLAGDATPVATFANIKTAFDAFEKARFQHPYDSDKQNSALAALRDAVTRGATEGQKWREVSKWIETASKLREAEDKHEQLMRAVVPVADIFLFLGELVGVLRGRITDPQMLRDLQSDIDRLLLPSGETKETIN